MQKLRERSTTNADEIPPERAGGARQMTSFKFLTLLDVEDPLNKYVRAVRARAIFDKTRGAAVRRAARRTTATAESAARRSPRDYG